MLKTPNVGGLWLDLRLRVEVDFLRIEDRKLGFSMICIHT